MRLRQVALVAKDLASTEARLEKLLGLAPGYHDPGIIKFGLDNWVATLGDTYLEVVSPVQDETTAGRYLDRRGGDGGYMVLLQVDDLEAVKERLHQAEARVVWTAEGVDPGGATTTGLHIHPRDCGGAILSLDASSPHDAWVWAGEDWQSKQTEFLDQIVGVELQSGDPQAMAEKWSGILGADASPGQAPDGRPAFLLDLDEAAKKAEQAYELRSASRGVLRFVTDQDGRGDGVSAFDVRVRDADALSERAAAMGVELGQGENMRWIDESGVRIFFLGV